MENKILKMYANRGFFLDKEMLEYFSKLNNENVKKIMKILSKLCVGKKIITKKLFDKYKNEFSELLFDNKVKKDVKILTPLEFPLYKIKINDFINHFRDRYSFIREILEKKGFDNLTSIRKIGFKNGFWTIIVIITGKRITKNKNLLIEVEDLNGKSIILINRENKKLFSDAKKLLLDDVVAFRVSGSEKMLFASEIIFPDAELKEEKKSEFDNYVAFSSDFHVGSTMFLEDRLLKFISWLNGELGDKRQREIAKKVKYLFLTGDNIDGVSHYPGQEKYLNIKTCRGQYLKLEEILRKIRDDIEIIMCSGQHDAVWVGEPQLIIPKKWAPGLHEMKNLHIVPNPSLIEIESNFKILMYHGASINGFINEISEFRMKFGHMHPTRIVKEMLKRRHLAPTHGIMDYIPYGGKDFSTIKIIPDIIATADQHRAEVEIYNNILMIASSCWQSITPFEKKVGNIPEPCRVPIFNLKTREIKIIDFSKDSKEIIFDKNNNYKLKNKEDK